MLVKYLKVCTRWNVYLKDESDLNAQLKFSFIWNKGKQIWGTSGKRYQTGPHKPIQQCYPSKMSINSVLTLMALELRLCDLENMYLSSDMPLNHNTTLNNTTVAKRMKKGLILFMQMPNYLRQFSFQKTWFSDRRLPRQTRTHWASEDSIMMPTNILLKWEADQALDIHFYRKKG